MYDYFTVFFCLLLRCEKAFENLPKSLPCEHFVMTLWCLVLAVCLASAFGQEAVAVDASGSTIPSTEAGACDCNALTTEVASKTARVQEIINECNGLLMNAQVPVCAMAMHCCVVVGILRGHRPLARLHPTFEFAALAHAPYV